MHGHKILKLKKYFTALNYREKLFHHVENPESPFEQGSYKSRAILRYYAASSGNLLPTFRNNMSVIFLTPEDGADRLSRNVGKKFKLLAA